MSDIDDYNADAQRLQAALDAGKSDYVWRVRWWGAGVESEIMRTAEELGTTYEQERAAALGEIRVRSRTKQSYDKGRLTMLTHISRDLLHDNDMAMATHILTHSADITLEDKLAEASQ